jgi:predicted TPR repeat methyltransferase
MGQRLRDRVDHLEGIDLSAAMIAETARKGVYDRLEKAELVAFLKRHVAEADLVTAADVFIYCGALPRQCWMRWFRRCGPGDCWRFRSRPMKAKIQYFCGPRYGMPMAWRRHGKH